MLSKLRDKKGTSTFRQLCTVVVFLGVMAIPSGAAPELPATRIVIQNSPDEAEFSVNGVVVHLDEYGVIPVVPGPVLLEAKRKRTVMYSSFFMLDSNEVKTITFNCSEACALFHLVSEPERAILSMDGEILGMTPYLNRFIKPGSYSIMITAPGYIPVIRRIDLTLSSEMQSYVMEQTQAVRDSLTAAKLAMRRGRQQTMGILFGIAGIGFAAGGAYHDWRAYGFVKEMRSAADAYDASLTRQECEKNREEYERQRDLAKKPILYRNILYGTSAAFFTGLFLRFLF